MGVWVFGYGSLIWNPGFLFKRKKEVRLTGWCRRFWQASDDHRGTPQSPGRVVTLVPQESGSVSGVAYLLEGDEQAILSYLDHREKCGYERCYLQVQTVEGEMLSVLTYIGGEHSGSFVGPEEAAVTAAVIREAWGPSGSNLEYLMKLHEALTELGSHDPHIDELMSLTHPQSPQL